MSLGEEGRGADGEEEVVRMDEVNKQMLHEVDGLTKIIS